MSSYTISPKLKSNWVFILQKSELEKRFEPFFYVPELFTANTSCIKFILHSPFALSLMDAILQTTTAK